MLKFFTNLIFIIMLFFFLSGMPMNMEILDINPFQPVIETPAHTETPVQFTLSDSIAISPINPQNMTFTILASDSQQPNEAFLDTIQITITSPSKSPAALSLSDFSYAVNPTDNPLKTEIIISLGEIASALSDGYYQVDVTSDYPTNTNDETANFSVIAFDKTYLTTSNTEQNGKLSMTLYFPTADYQQLVPISTRVAYPENRSRTLFKTLYAGPIEALGLLSGPTIPYASRIYISNGVASIYIYSPEQTGYEDHFERVTESITNSMTSLSFITSVKFYIDNKNDTPFGNVDLQADYAPTKTNVAYLNYSLDSEYSMMLPLPLDSFEATGDTVYNRILAALKGALSYTDGEHIEGISPSLPAQLTLLNTSLSDTSLLTLNFSSECLGCLDSLDAEIASAAAQRAVDSIVYSYCSLEDVSAVQILIDGQSVSDFYGVDLSEPLQPALYINMDPSIS